MTNECAWRCTTRFESAHRTVLRKVLYRHHPWFRRRVCIHGAVDKDGFVVFRCTLEGGPPKGRPSQGETQAMRLVANFSVVGESRTSGFPQQGY
jgi:hypothetical protein